MKLSPNFTLDDFTNSEYAILHGINNTPSAIVLNNLRNTAASLELVRELLDTPIHISSGYRSPTLNRAIGGSSTSAHCLGFAVDFTSRYYGDCKAICKAIMASTIKYDQLIYEGTWVHISFDPKYRGKDLTATFNRGKVTYTKGIS